MKKLKFIAVVLMVVMILSVFAGCKSSDKTTTADQTTKGTTESSTDSKANEEKKEVTIEVLFWDPENQESSTKVMNEFRAKYPHIKLDFQYMTGGGINQNIQPRVTANNLPDMFSFSAGAYAAELADTGWLADVSDTKAWQNMYDSLKAAFTSPGGVRYGVSNGLGILVMYYNQDIFDKAGAKVPTNFEELIEASKKIRAAGYQPMALAASHTSSITHALTSPLLSFNVQAKDPEAKAKIKAKDYDFSSPEMLQALKDIKTLLDNGVFHDGHMGTDYNGAVNMFLDGQAAMLVNGTWLANQCLSANFNVGMALIPYNKAGEPQATTTIPETGQVLSAKSSPEKHEAAKLLLEFFYGEGYKYFQNPRGCIPPFPEDKYPGEMVLHDTLKEFIKISNSVTAYSSAGEYLPAGVGAEFPKQIQNLLSGSATPEQVAKALNDALAEEK